jgi:antitoxin component YwqK of YwqJK toxin-antitoxin module
LSQAKNYQGFKKAFSDALYQNQTLSLFAPLSAESYTTLKKRQPHWMQKSTETYEDGSTRQILFFEVDGDREIPLKLQTFSHDALLEQEIDVITLDGEIIAHGPLISYFPSGEVSSISLYREGKPHGLSKKYSIDGKTVQSCHFNQGKLEGEWTSFYPDEKVKEQGSYRNNEKNGIWRSFHPNGKESHKVAYLLGKKSGEELFFSPDGTALGSGSYRDGKPYGRHERRHDNGTMAYLAIWDNDGKLLGPIVEWNELSDKILQYFLVDDKPDGDYEALWPNGKIKVRYHYSQGLFQGKQEEFYQTGARRLSCCFEEGNLIGVMEEWYLAGQKKKLASYKNGLIDGVSYEWYEDGAKKCEQCFVLGEEDGLQSGFWPNGNKEFEENFSQGKPHGSFQKWHESGEPSFISSYNNGLKDGFEKVWQEDGRLIALSCYKNGKPIGKQERFFPEINPKKSLQLEQELFYNEEGKLHGEQKKYHANGILKALLTYDNGVLQEKKALWDKEANLLEEAHYDQGLLEGEHFIQQSDGSEIVSHYHNNILHGLRQVFYPPMPYRGKVKAWEGYFVQGKPEGEVAEYNEVGIKISSTFYKAGKKEGLVSIFNKEGQLLISAEFQDDDQNGMAYEYYPNGQMRLQANFVKNLKEGEEKGFHDDGKPLSVRHYKAGKLDGLAMEWNREGVVVFEADYREGMRHGKFNKYDDKGEPRLLQTFENDQAVTKWRAITNA